jgi:hypothetical protein
MTFAVNIAQSGSNNQTMRNRIINGAMVIDQRNNGASVSLTGGTTQYTLDRWNAIRVNTGAVSVQRSTTAPPNFINSLQVTVGTGVATGASDYTTIGQRLEGLNVADFGWGTVNAQPVTLSFWVRSSLTGNFGISIQNPSSYSFIGSYTINAANTWEYKTISIPAPTISTFPTDNSTSFFLNWDLGVGSAFSGVAGSWTASNIFGLTGGVKLSATTGATFNITGVQLEEGTAASPFENRLYGTELNLCQRYFQRVDTNGGNQRIVFGVAYSSTEQYFLWSFQQKMRASPTVSVPNLGNVLKEGVAWYTPTSAFIIATAPDFANIGSVLSSSVFSLGDFSWWGRNTGDLTLTASAEL